MAEVYPAAASGAVVAFYSIIHLEPGDLAPAFAEICRVLRPDGLVLVSFHVVPRSGTWTSGGART